jgi:hypothetical protein
VSPILIRPVREQLEHDRVIRLLQAKWKRKYDVQINVGDDRNASIKVGPMVLFPDVVLTTTDAPRRLAGVVEVETGESVNNLEAMAQWAHFAKSKAPFYLYIPASSLEIARHLCAEHQIVPAELWTFMPIGEQIRFALMQKTASAEPAPARSEKPARAEKPARPAKEAKAPRPARAAAPARRKAPPSRPSVKRPAKRAAGGAAPVRKAGARKAARPKPRTARNHKRR